MSVTNDMPDAPKIHKEINTVDLQNRKYLLSLPIIQKARLVQ